jgi:hypothetical protein
MRVRERRDRWQDTGSRENCMTLLRGRRVEKMCVEKGATTSKSNEHERGESYDMVWYGMVARNYRTVADLCEAIVCSKR